MRNPILHRTVLIVQRHLITSLTPNIPKNHRFLTMGTNGERMKVLVTRPDVPKVAMDMLTNRYDVEIWSETSIARSDLLKKIKGKHAIFAFLSDKLDSEFLDHAGSTLKAIGTMSVGVDHVDLDECKKRNVIVGHTPGVLTNAVAELTMALLLATARRLIEANKEVTNGGWMKTNWSPVYMCGMQIEGSVIGIVGLGRIGQAVAKILRAFSVKEILYCGHNPKPEGDAIGARFVPFNELLQTSDIVVCLCALTKETTNLFNAKAFSLMKPGAIFINSSRGAIVDHDALFDALQSNQIRGAGLDVCSPEPLPVDHPLTTLNNCVILPHIGSATLETRIKMACMTSENIIGALEGMQMPARCS